VDETSLEEESKYAIVEESGLDIFGQTALQMKKQYECICPNCQRSLAAQRFAPHLEKCMGMGRNSSRIASKRIASSTGKNGAESDLEDYDNSADTDWNYSNDSKKAKKKREKPAPATNGLVKKVSRSAVRNGSESGPQTMTPNADIASYEALSPEDKKAYLAQICGVISGHTKKMCTRTLRCPQHSEDQRKQLRSSLLTGSATATSLAFGTGTGTAPAVASLATNAATPDAELGDEFDSGSDSLRDPGRDRLWGGSIDSRDSSPSDSSSTNTNMSSGKRKSDNKREPKSGGSSKKSKPSKKSQPQTQLLHNIQINSVSPTVSSAVGDYLV
jgi:SAGA-associated factor 11